MENTQETYSKNSIPRRGPAARCSRARAIADAGLDLAPPAGTRGALLAVRAEAAWREGNGEPAAADADAAMALLPPGSAAWFEVACVAALATPDGAGIARALDAAPVDARAADAKLVCLARVVDRLRGRERAAVEAWLDTGDRPAAQSLTARAWEARSRHRARPLHFARRLAALDEAHALFTRAGDLRAAARAMLESAELHLATGDWARAASEIDAVRDTAALLERDALRAAADDLAERLAYEVSGEAPSRLQTDAARVLAVSAALDAGALDDARALVDRDDAPLAARARVFAKLGDRAALSALVEALVREVDDDASASLAHRVHARLALAEVREALGEPARAPIAEARALVHTAARTLEDPVREAWCRSRPRLHARIEQRYEEGGGSD